MHELVAKLGVSTRSKFARIPADARATISIATGYCRIGSKSNSWRLLLDAWVAAAEA